MGDIVLEHVDKVYDNGFQAITDLNLHIEDGEFMVLVGPSGCGKSTALRMVAGLEDISDGELFIGGTRMNETPPRDRDIAMVFQSYALYPHMSVYDNIAFGLKLRKMSKSEIDQRVRKAADVLGLTDYLNNKPKALSGGQRQRVAMGRAIVREPMAFLMDEPLSNLDAKLRVQMRAEIAKLQKDLGVTTLYVTHDQVEAMTMGDRVAVIKRGVLQQVATPRELYLDPDNFFIGAFMGSPPMNLGLARIESRDGGLGFVMGDKHVVIDPELLETRPAMRGYEGKEVVIGLRPEDLHHPEEAPDIPESQTMRVTVELIEALGSELMVHFTIDSPPVRSDDLSTETVPIVGGPEAPEHATWVAMFNPRTFVKVAEHLDLKVDTSHLYAFDKDTGLAIRT